jgi:hypothetical protein
LGARQRTHTPDSSRRFIGELFRAESLRVKIILHCIEKLLGSLEDPDDV